MIVVKQVALELQCESVVWLIGAMVCLHAVLWVPLFVSAGSGCQNNE